MNMNPNRQAPEHYSVAQTTCHSFYIDGRWMPSTRSATMPIINPATEEVVGEIALGGADSFITYPLTARCQTESFLWIARNTIHSTR